MNKFKLSILIIFPIVFIVLIAGVFSTNVSPYISVTELISGNVINRNVQVYGKAVIESISFDTSKSILTFDITDGTNNVTVSYKGMVNNLENSTEVVAVGQYDKGVFNAEKILVKCPSKYQEANLGEN
ncbi:MAG TPA: cytochrome c maturation protein CcmE [Nitrososphaerales archaeon]